MATDKRTDEPVLPTAAAATGSSPGTTARTKTRREAWWTIHPFRGMVNDLRRRAPYYASDWLDAWDYRVVPATVYMYFAKCVFHMPCSRCF